MTSEEIFDFIEELRKEGEELGLPVMRRATAAFLAKLVSAKRPERALDIGTCSGVSCLTTLAAGVKCVTTIERDGERVEYARKNFKKCGVTPYVIQIEGDCLNEMAYLSGNVYDLVILDGPKSSIKAQYDMSLDITRKGGIIFVDDINYHGMIAGTEAKHKQRTIIKGIREFMEYVKNDERVDAKFYDIEDGFAVLERK